MTFVASDADKIEKLIKLSMLKLSPALGVHRKVPFSILITTNIFDTLRIQVSCCEEAAVRWTVIYKNYIPGTCLEQ